MKKILKIGLMFVFLTVISLGLSGCDLFGEKTTGETYAITVAGSIGGSVTGGGLYEGGTTITMTATPEAGYVFWHWVQSSQVISESATFQMTATESTNIVAFFLLEDQTHLMGNYYVYSYIDSVGRVLNTSEAVMQYYLYDDNTYVSSIFVEGTDTWVTEETGTYGYDNGDSVIFTANDTDTKYFYTLNATTGELALDCSINVWTTITLRPMPENQVAIERAYELTGGVMNDTSIVINPEEPETFVFHADNTYTWSYYVDGSLVEDIGTYEILGLSLILAKEDAGVTTFTIYELMFETNAGVPNQLMTFANKLENNLTSESRLYTLLDR